MAQTPRLAVMASLLLAGASAHGQERERSPEPEEPGVRARRARTLLAPPPAPGDAPPSTYDPSDEAPPPGALPAPDRPAPSRREGGAPAKPDPKDEPRDAAPEVEVLPSGRLKLGLGYDSNVFRAESGARRDGFFHGLGEGNLLVRFPGERELFASVTGEGYAYFRQQLADEVYATGFLDYYHPVSSLLDLEVQNNFEYSRQNLLDDNGDLLPRSRFSAYDDEVRAAAIAHVTDELSLELSGGGRYKRFDDSPGLPSLDYYEARGSLGARWKIPWWSDGKLKLRYTFRDRLYLELLANSRDGTLTTGAPELELRRQQIQGTFLQKAELLGFKVQGQVGYTFTFNEDTFENDRSYREHAGSLRVEAWLVPEWTRLELETRLGAREFLVRRTLTASALRQKYVEASAVLWQKLVDHVALVVEGNVYFYRSTDLRSSYARFTLQAGVEASF